MNMYNYTSEVFFQSIVEPWQFLFGASLGFIRPNEIKIYTEEIGDTFQKAKRQKI